MILRLLLPRTFGILGVLEMWKAMIDDPVLLCACQDDEWCGVCEPERLDPCVAKAPWHRPAA
jgi:hypothetical protein